MQRIVAYEMVQELNVRNLEAAIRSHIGEGWEPVGNPICANGLYYQALVLYDRSPTWVQWVAKRWAIATTRPDLLFLISTAVASLLAVVLVYVMFYHIYPIGGH